MSVLVGYCLEGVFCKLVAVDVGIYGCYLIYGSIEWYLLFHTQGDDVADRFDVRCGDEVVIYYESRIVVEG